MFPEKHIPEISDARRRGHAVYRRVVTPAQRRTLAAIETELARLARYDDESIVHDGWDQAAV